MNIKYEYKVEYINNLLGIEKKSRKLLKSRSNSPNRSKICTEENMHYAWMLLIWESHLSKLQMLILKLANDTQTAHITMVRYVVDFWTKLP